MSSCIISANALSGFVEFAVIAFGIVSIHYAVKFLFNYQKSKKYLPAV